MKTMLSMPSTSSRTVNVNSPIHAFGSVSHSDERSFSVLSWASSCAILSQVPLAPELVHAEIFGNHISVFPAHSESNSPRHCIQFGNEIAVASDAFNGTLVTSLLLLYEDVFSLFSSFNCHRVDRNYVGAELVRHGESLRWRTEHNAAIAFSDHE